MYVLTKFVLNSHFMLTIFFMFYHYFLLLFLYL